MEDEPILDALRTAVHSLAPSQQLFQTLTQTLLPNATPSPHTLDYIRHHLRTWPQNILRPIEHAWKEALLNGTFPTWCPFSFTHATFPTNNPPRHLEGLQYTQAHYTCVHFTRLSSPHPLPQHALHTLTTHPSWTSLTHLNLPNTTLSPQDLHTLTRLKNLHTLTLAHSHLTPKHLQALTSNPNFTTLHTLSLPHTSTPDPSELFAQHVPFRLRTLSIPRGDLPPNTLRLIFQSPHAPHLHHLNITKTENLLPTQPLHTTHPLRTLRLSMCDLSLETLQHILNPTSFPSLHTLDLSNTALPPNTIRSLQTHLTFPHLAHLDLSEIDLSHNDVQTLLKLPSLPTLQSLHLACSLHTLCTDSPNLVSHFIRTLSTSPIHTLNLANNPIQPEHLQHIKTIQHLRHLNLSGCFKHTHIPMKTIAEHLPPHLHTLRLDFGHNFTQRDLHTLLQHPNTHHLHTLSMRFCNLDKIHTPPQPLHLPNLHCLDIATNGLTAPDLHTLAAWMHTPSLRVLWGTTAHTPDSTSLRNLFRKTHDRAKL